MLDLTYQNRIDTWDYQWEFNCLFQHGLATTPAANLVENIGITGTHSVRASEEHCVKRVGVYFELVHPRYIYPDSSYERYIYTKIRNVTRLTNFVKKVLYRTPLLYRVYPLFRDTYYWRQIKKTLSRNRK